jgi:hypothetical protein
MIPERWSAAPDAAQQDDRWVVGMNGWRVFCLDTKRYGEVTGYSHHGDEVYVVLDGEELPRRVYWPAVRPA